MLEEKYLRLDDLAAPDGYVAPFTSEDLAYIAYFRPVRHGEGKLAVTLAVRSIFFRLFR